jgi:hypothetical protein
MQNKTLSGENDSVKSDNSVTPQVIARNNRSAEAAAKPTLMAKVRNFWHHLISK